MAVAAAAASVAALVVFAAAAAAAAVAAAAASAVVIVAAPAEVSCGCSPVGAIAWNLKEGAGPIKVADSSIADAMEG